MSLLQAVVDIQDSAGNSVVPTNAADGTRPLVKIRIGAGITSTVTRSGDVAIVALAATGGGSGGSFTTLDASGATTLADTLDVGGAATFDDTLSVGNTLTIVAGNLEFTAPGVVALAGGQIQGAAFLDLLGAAAPSAPSSGTARVYLDSGDSTARIENSAGAQKLIGLINVVTKTTTYSAVHGDHVRADTTSGGFTVTCPVTLGHRVEVKKIASANTLTIAPASGTIDGSATLSVTVQYTSLTIVGNGTGCDIW